MSAGELAELRLEYPCPSRDERRWFVLRASALQGLEGFVVAAHFDITTRKEAEVSLEDSEARLRAIVDTAIDAIVTIDEVGTIDSFNASAERIFGYRAAEVIGRNVRMLMPSPYREEHDGYIARYLRTGVPRIIGMGRQLVGQRRDGTTFPLDLGVSEVIDGERRFTGILRDLSDRKRLEDEFRHAQKMEAVGRLAGGIAHDFNNLLAGIIGCCRIAARELGREQRAKELVDEIRGAAERGAAMTRQLLAFSRKRPSEARRVELNAVLADLEHILRQLLGEDIELTLALAESGGPIVADPGQIEQIVMNLAVNAREAMPRGGSLSIVVEDLELTPTHALWCKGLEPGPYALLRVTDTGCGMDEETREKIFEPFFTTKGPGQGTGLGLSTVYGIVQRFQGAVHVYSEADCGTTFRIYFPRVTEPAEEAAVPEVAEPPDNGGKETILLVEDDRLVRVGLRHELEDLGYEVLVAADAEEALELCLGHEDGIDLLLTDIVMPGRSGAELARELRTRKPDLKALFMSAFPSEVLIEQGRLEADQPTLEKPFAVEEMSTKLREILDG